MTTKAAAIATIDQYFTSGAFKADLARRVAIRTESPEPERRPELYRYLNEEMTPYLEAFGFSCALYENPIEGKMPFLVATRHEGDDLPTVMTYGHGDVVPLCRILPRREYDGRHIPAR